MKSVRLLLLAMRECNVIRCRLVLIFVVVVGWSHFSMAEGDGWDCREELHEADDRFAFWRQNGNCKLPCTLSEDNILSTLLLSIKRDRSANLLPCLVYNREFILYSSCHDKSYSADRLYIYFIVVLISLRRAEDSSESQSQRMARYAPSYALY